MATHCRAYKLGKRRWSYNQVELVLCELGEGARMLSVKQAVNMGTDNFKEEVRVSEAAGGESSHGVDLWRGGQGQRGSEGTSGKGPVSPQSTQGSEGKGPVEGTAVLQGSKRVCGEGASASKG